jgi:hypothetical protein
MKARIAVVALVLTSSVWADAPRQSTEPAPWLVADRRMPTCKSDNRDLPVGTTWCREGRTWICSPRGWEDTRKPC